jgi:hypothetical protein
MRVCGIKLGFSGFFRIHGLNLTVFIRTLSNEAGQTNQAADAAYLRGYRYAESFVRQGFSGVIYTEG